MIPSGSSGLASLSQSQICLQMQMPAEIPAKNRWSPSLCTGSEGTWGEQPRWLC